MRVAKYEFNSKEQFQEKFNALHTIDEEGNLIPNYKFSITEIGFRVLDQAIYNEEGEVITPSVIDNKWHVDVLWYNLESHPEGWVDYSIDIDSEGMHSFLGVSYLDNKL